LPDWAFSNFFYSEPGLNRASSIDNKYYLHTIAKTVSSADYKNYPFELFYLFGWTGELSSKDREEAAKELYETLKKQSLEYKKQYGNLPKITLINT